MPRKKKLSTATAPALASHEAAAPGPASTGYWPQEFPAPRKVVLLVAALVVWGIVLFALASANSLLSIKIVIAWCLGLDNPMDLGVAPTSWDTAGVLWYGTFIAAAAWVHPIIGIASLALVRPWLDGYTFPTDNMYFLWGILLSFTVWAVRSLMRGTPMRHRGLVLLFGAYIAISVLTLATTWNFGDTYTTLLLWLSYFFLFALVANSITDRKQAVALMAVLAFTWFFQNLYSILQYKYLLPYLRVLLNQQPELIPAFFGDANSAEIANRLNRNRAFGTMLFPNAMAAFLVLGIPFNLAGAWLGWRGLLRAWPGSVREATTHDRLRAAGWSLILWLVLTCVLFFMFQFPGSYSVDGVPWYSEPLTAAFLAALFAAAVAAILFAVAIQRGAAAMGRLLQASFLTISSVMLVYGLLVTFSRGGLLALAFGIGVGVLVYFFPIKLLPPSLSRTLVPVATALILFVSLLFAQPTPGQEAAPAPAPAPVPAPQQAAPAPAPPAAQAAPPMPVPTGPPTDILKEGVNLTTRDMLDPSTMGLRIDYWKNAARMFLDNFFTGVGLGNFEWGYPIYQIMGEGDVREAHNGYLQAFAETGILGGLVLCAFVGIWLLWGALKIIGMPAGEDRLLLAGLYAGIVCFLAHAFMEISFQHPSLMFFLMVSMGLFMAWHRLATPRQLVSASSSRDVYLLLPLLVIAALTLGLSLRVYAQELGLSRVKLLNVNGQQDMDHRQKVAEVLATQLPQQWQNPKAPKTQIPLRSARVFFPDVEKIQEFGAFYAPGGTPNAQWRKMADGEQVPPEALVLILKPGAAHAAARERIEQWINELTRMDAIFPHDHQLAVRISRLYRTLALWYGHPKLQQTRLGYFAKQRAWAEEALRRNPNFADLHLVLAESLWDRNLLEGPMDEKLRNYEESLRHLERAISLAPTQPHFYAYYSEALKGMANLYAELGQPEEATEAQARAKEFQEKSVQLAKDRVLMGMTS